jgi:hypothetical protein
MVKAAVNKENALFTRNLDLKWRKKLPKCYTRSTLVYGTETSGTATVDQKYFVNFKKLCWWKMEKIRWTDRVRNEEVLHRVKETQKGREYEKENVSSYSMSLRNWLDTCKLIEEAWDRSVWRTRFDRDYGPVVRQTLQQACMRKQTYKLSAMFCNIQCIFIQFKRSNILNQLYRRGKGI